MTPCLDKAIQRQNEAQRAKAEKAAQEKEETLAGITEALPSLIGTAVTSGIDLSSALFTSTSEALLPKTPIVDLIANPFLTAESSITTALKTPIKTPIEKIVEGARLILKGQKENKEKEVANASGEATHIKIDVDGNVSHCTAEEAVISELSAIILKKDEGLNTEEKEAKIDAKTLDLEKILGPIKDIQKELDIGEPGVAFKIEIDLTEALLEEIGEKAANAFVSEIQETIKDFLTKDPEEEQKEKEADLHECEFHDMANKHAQDTMHYSKEQQEKVAREAQNKEAMLRRHEAKVMESLGLNDMLLLQKRLKEIDENRARAIKTIDKNRTETLKNIDKKRARTLKALDTKRTRTLRAIDLESKSAAQWAA